MNAGRQKVITHSNHRKAEGGSWRLCSRSGREFLRWGMASAALGERGQPWSISGSSAWFAVAKCWLLPGSRAVPELRHLDYHASSSGPPSRRNRRRMVGSMCGGSSG
jgi:hypothetical protein